MVHSMTGYGRAVQTLRGREIIVELRSVNNRFLDCSVRLPRAFSYVEEAVKQRVKESVSRGKVDVFVTVNSTGEDESVRVALNRPVLEGYLTALRAICADYQVRDDISAMTLARMPEVFQTEKALGELGDKVDAGEKADVEAKLNALKEALKGTDIEAIKAKQEELQKAFYAISEKVYKQAAEAQQAAGQQPGAGAAGNGGSTGDDGVVDADFKEV